MWEGDVILSESKTRSTPMVYVVDWELDGKLLKASFVATDSTAELRAIN